MRFPFAGRAIRSEPDCNPVDHRRRGHRRDGARGLAQGDRLRRLRTYGAEPGGILIRLRRMMLPGGDRCHGEKIMDRGSVYRRCGCRDKATGRLLGARCPGLRSREHGSWYFSADLPSATGEPHRVRRGGFATQDAASAALEALASPAAGPEPELSTGEWLSRWLASRLSLRASTSCGYAAHLRSYLLPYHGGIPLAALTAGDVQAMFTAVIRNEGAAGAAGERGDPAPDPRHAACRAQRRGPCRADQREPGPLPGAAQGRPAPAAGLDAGADRALAAGELPAWRPGAGCRPRAARRGGAGW